MERTLVNSLLGGDELGFYAAGSKIAMALMLISQAFQTAWGPFSLAVYKTPDVAETYNWVLKGFTIGICSVVLLLSAIGGPLINILATARYAGAGIVIFPLSMGLAIQSTSWITGIGIILSKKSYLSLYGYGAFLFVTGFSMYYLGQLFGIAGVALGVMLGRLAEFLVSTIIAQKAYPIGWHFVPPVAIMAITMLIGGCGSLITARFTSIKASFFFIAGLLIVLTAGWFIILSKAERYQVRSAICSFFYSSSRHDSSGSAASTLIKSLWKPFSGRSSKMRGN
jgi:O-antigen/teichoic acid export membrane protein